MQEAWVDLQCAECDARWEENPSDLPAADATFRCPHCKHEDITATFMATQRGLEILRSFHK